MEKLEIGQNRNNELKIILEYARDNNIPVLRTQTANILEMLVDIHRPLEILEIGTAIGYSGSLMLNAGDINSHLTTIEKDENSSKIAKTNFQKLGLKDRVTVILGDAMEVLPKLAKKYDFIFLDGPKGQYVHYLPYLLSLMSNNGVLVADNVLFRGMVLGNVAVEKRNETIVKRLREFLKEITTNPVLKTTVLEIEDGVSVTINRGVHSKLLDKIKSTSRLNKN